MSHSNHPNSAARGFGKYGKILPLLLIPVSLTLLNCGDNVSPPRDTPARMTIRTVLDPVQVLGKNSEIRLEKLVIISTSSVGDTAYDTVTSATEPALNPSTTEPQTIIGSRDVPSLRSWKIVARAYDANDSVTHADSATTPILNPGDQLSVNMNLSSSYVQYEAKFSDIPDSIASSTAGTSKQVLRLTRLTLMVDGATVVDSTATPNFPAHDTSTLAYDYVKVGSRQITLSAYGLLGSATSPTLLFRGSTVISVGTGTDHKVIIPLAWYGPTTGTGTVNVTLSRIGKVIVVGEFPGTF
jgi:hypothetical protein